MIKQTTAGFDMGLGDGSALKAQLAESLDEQRKRLAGAGNCVPDPFAWLLASASSSAYGLNYRRNG
jgi:hypothetical protein